MPERIKVKPARKGLLVRMVKDRTVLRRYLKEEGEEVNNSLYWRKRIKVGDVVLVSEIKKPIPETEGGE